jgi:hypothetical protein
MAEPDRAAAGEAGARAQHVEGAPQKRTARGRMPRWALGSALAACVPLLVVLLQWILGEPRPAPPPPPAPAPPTGTIDLPAEGAEVTNRIALRGTANAIPDRHTTWIAVQVKNEYWMKDPEVTTRPRWQVEILEGSYDPKDLTLLLVLATPEEDARIRKWFNDAKLDHVHPGLDRLPGAVLAAVPVHFRPCLAPEIDQPAGALAEEGAERFCAPRRLRVSWQPDGCAATLQAYQGHGETPVFQGSRSKPGGEVILPPGVTELKLWGAAGGWTSRWVNVKESCP